MKLFPIRLHIEELDGTEGHCWLLADGTIISEDEALVRYGEYKVMAWDNDQEHYIFISKEKRQ